MPKTINWEITEVSFYKFVCKNLDILFSYVGHTVSFRHRKSSHKTECNSPNRKNYNIPLYKYMREHGGFENWNMIVIHTQICKDKRDAERIETELMEQQQLKLNAKRAYISEEQLAIQKASYREQHKEQALKYGAEYREQHKEQAVEYREQRKEQTSVYNAEYHEQHKEQKKTYNAEYYEKNRDILNAKSKAKRALLKAQLNCELLDATNS